MDSRQTKRQWRQHLKLVSQQLVASSQIQSRSAAIMDQLNRLPQLTQAGTICVYVSLADEVQTHDWIRSLLVRQSATVAVPYCVDRDLQLVQLTNWSELRPGRFGILEPDEALRSDTQRQLAATAIDAFVVPGRAFTNDGLRLGNGWGFYDRLLQRARPDAFTVGVAFTEQIVAELPSEPHDVRLQMVVSG
ncbi:MAG: 5-formyltetrahydrofolate cyclo-ligase [Pirellulales bacterium]